MHPKICLVWCLALLPIGARADFFNDIGKMIKPPSFGVEGGETARSRGQLEAENSQLRQLIRQQDEKIKLLESRLKYLEGSR
jgi:hypothetical protein